MNDLDYEHSLHYGSPTGPPIGYECELCGEWQVMAIADCKMSEDIRDRIVNYCNECYKGEGEK